MRDKENKVKTFFNVYLFFEREHEHEQGREERGGDTESKAGSRLWSVSTEPDVGLKLMNQPWDHDLSWSHAQSVDWATQVPPKLKLLISGSVFAFTGTPVGNVGNATLTPW